MRVLRGYGDTLRIGDIFTVACSGWTTQDQSAFILTGIMRHSSGTIGIGAVRLGSDDSRSGMDVYGAGWQRTFTKHGTALRRVLEKALR